MQIDQMTEQELRKTLHKISDVFGIGSAARTASTIIANATNASRRSDCLSRIERIHVVVETDEETGEQIESSALNWGDCPEAYEQRYRSLVPSA